MFKKKRDETCAGAVLLTRPDEATENTVLGYLQDSAEPIVASLNMSAGERAAHPNTVVIGRALSGKWPRWLLPLQMQACKRGENIVVLDQNARSESAMGIELYCNGYQMYRMDLYRPLRSSQWDLFSFFRDQPIDIMRHRTQLFTETFCRNAMPVEISIKAKQASALLMQSVIMLICLSAKETEHATTREIYQAISKGDAYLSEIFSDDNLTGTCRAAGAIYQQYTTERQSAFDFSMDALLTALLVLTEASIQHMLAHSSSAVCAQYLEEQKSAFYITYPTDAAPKAALALAMLDLVMDIYHNWHPDTEHPTTHILLSDLDAYQYIPDLSDWLSTLRSTSVSLTCAIESIAQIQRLLPSQWNDFLNSADLLLGYGFNSQDSASWFSDKSVTTEPVQRGLFRKKRLTEPFTCKELLSAGPDTAFAILKDKGILRLRKQNPLYFS